MKLLPWNLLGICCGRRDCEHHHCAGVELANDRDRQPPPRPMYEPDLGIKGPFRARRRGPSWATGALWVAAIAAAIVLAFVRLYLP